MIYIIFCVLVIPCFSINCEHSYINRRCNGYYDYPKMRWFGGYSYSSSWDTNQCFESDSRSFISCSNPGSYSYYFGSSSGYSDTISMYRTCHSYCTACNGIGCGNCQSCNSPYNKWLRT